MDARQCPWCERFCLKDNNCSYIFACGLQENGKFVIGTGCGRSWCWDCGKRYCSLYIDPVTGKKSPTAKDNHDAVCCKKEEEFAEFEYCGGGHSGHCPKRW